MREQATRVPDDQGSPVVVERGAALLALALVCLVAFMCGASVGWLANVDHWYRALGGIVR